MSVPRRLPPFDSFHKSMLSTGQGHTAAPVSSSSRKRGHEKEEPNANETMQPFPKRLACEFPCHSSEEQIHSVATEAIEKGTENVPQEEQKLSRELRNTITNLTHRVANLEDRSFSMEEKLDTLVREVRSLAGSINILNENVRRGHMLSQAPQQFLSPQQLQALSPSGATVTWGQVPPNPPVVSQRPSDAQEKALMTSWRAVPSIQETGAPCTILTPPSAQKKLSVNEISQDLEISRRIAQAKHLVDNNQPDSAIAVLEGVLLKSPGNAEALVLQLQIFLKQGELEKACALRDRLYQKVESFHRENRLIKEGMTIADVILETNIAFTAKLPNDSLVFLLKYNTKFLKKRRYKGSKILENTKLALSLKPDDLYFQNIQKEHLRQSFPSPVAQPPLTLQQLQALSSSGIPPQSASTQSNFSEKPQRSLDSREELTDSEREEEELSTSAVVQDLDSNGSIVEVKQQGNINPLDSALAALENEIQKESCNTETAFKLLPQMQILFQQGELKKACELRDLLLKKLKMLHHQNQVIRNGVTIADAILGTIAKEKMSNLSYLFLLRYKTVFLRRMKNKQNEIAEITKIALSIEPKDQYFIKTKAWLIESGYSFEEPKVSA